MFQSPILFNQSFIRLPFDAGSHLTVLAASISFGRNSSVLMYQAGTSLNTTSDLHLQHTG